MSLSPHCVPDGGLEAPKALGVTKDAPDDADVNDRHRTSLSDENA